MVKFRENTSLKAFNTFGINAAARWFAPFGTLEELEELLSSYPEASLIKSSGPKSKTRSAKPRINPPLLILGGGSNILFTRDFNGLVLLNGIKGIEQVHEDEHYVYVRAGAGEIWHGFVQYCLQRNWAGVENLS